MFQISISPDEIGALQLASFREAYAILRKENLFAHRIALPEVKFYDYVPELH